MSSYDYTDRNNLTVRNQVLATCDYVFTGIFFFEALLKIIAMGFIINKYSYLRDPWNVIDITVVILGILAILPNIPNLKSVRVVRVFKPLRTFNTIPGMKSLVSSLLKSIPAIWNVLIFLSFIIMLMSILGVQAFQGSQYYFCRLTELPINRTYWPKDPEQPRQCGGLYTCNTGTYCGTPIDYNITLHDDGVHLNPLISYGLSNFDNVIRGMQFIFCLMSMDGWTQDMYNYMDSYYPFFPAIYFPLVVLVLAFILLNYFLAIIMNTFNRIAEEKRELDIQTRAKHKQLQKLMEARKNQTIGLSNKLGGFMLEQAAQNQVEEEEQKIKEELLQQLQNPLENEEEKEDGFPRNKEEEEEQNQEDKEDALELIEIVQSVLTVQNQLEKRAKTNIFYKFSLKVVENQWFTVILVCSIIANTVCLSMDSYPSDIGREQIIEKLNYFFFAIFFAEMILKIGGLGFKFYASDKFNILDALIILLSILDIVISNAFSTEKSGKKAILAFRGFRLLRVFKLANSWKKFQYLLRTIGESLFHMGSFTILLFVIITIYILFGMEIFAYRVKFSGVGVLDLENGISPQINCDDYLTSFLTLFIVLTQEGWREIMYQFYIAKGAVSYMYFMSFLVIGQMILINLFMAILLENFDMSEQEESAPTQNQIENLEAIQMIKSQNALKQRIKRLKKLFRRKCCKCLLKRNKKESIYQQDQLENSKQELNPHNTSQNQSQVIQDQAKQNKSDSENQSDDEQINQDILTPEQLEKLKEKKNKKTAKEKLKKLKLNLRLKRIVMSRRHIGKMNSQSLDQQPKPGVKGPGLKEMLVKNFEDQIQDKYINQKIKKAYKQHNIAKKVNDYEGNSLYLFSTRSSFRKTIYRFMKSKFMETLVTLLIIVSTVMLAIENPLIDPKSQLATALQYLEIIVTVFFAFEAILRIIASGLILNGPGSYLRQSWNCLDFTVVVTSIVSLSLINSKKLNMVKIFRLLRVLRPIRMINNNEGLKISLSALILAIPGVINVIIIQLLFMLIFGIIGVSFFKGSFYQCFSDPNSEFQDFSNVITRFDCLNIGGEWINADYNFDNIINAMLTLFNISTTNQWVSTMQRAQAIVGPNMQPQLFSQSYWAVYFVLFIIIGNFFVWNLFMGVVIQTFNEEKDRLAMNYLLKNKQKQWLNQKRMCLLYKPIMVVDSHSNCLREGLRRLSMHKWFDMFIMVCIIINTLVFAIDWLGAPNIVTQIQEVFNYIFTVIFSIEVFIKLIGLGPKTYFRDRWNLFDFLVSLGSIISIIIWNYNHMKIVRLTILIRMFRIIRIFKLVNKMKKLKLLFDTFISVIPSLTNVGGLLMLFLFIYAVIGVQLFSQIQLQVAIDVHNNFKNIGYALMLLVRSWTGEDWDSQMFDLTRQYSTTFQCSYSVDYESIQANGGVTNGCGSYAGYPFFLSFTILIPYTFVNLFVAVIIDGLEEQMFQQNLVIEEKDVEHFKKVWAKFDKQGTGLIPILSFPDFLFELGLPLGWDESYRNNKVLQQSFLVEINIDTFNNFYHYLFWDVLQGLTKIIFINKMMDIKVKKLRDRQEDITEEEVQKIKFLFKMDLEFEYQTDLQKNIQMLKIEIKDEKSLNKKVKGSRDMIYSSCQFKSAQIIINALSRLKAKREARKDIQRRLELGLIGKKPNLDNPSNNQGGTVNIRSNLFGNIQNQKSESKREESICESKERTNRTSEKQLNQLNELEQIMNLTGTQQDSFSQTKNALLFHQSPEEEKKQNQNSSSIWNSEEMLVKTKQNKILNQGKIDFNVTNSTDQLKNIHRGKSKFQGVNMEEEKVIHEEIDQMFQNTRGEMKEQDGRFQQNRPEGNGGKRILKGTNALIISKESISSLNE